MDVDKEVPRSEQVSVKEVMRRMTHACRIVNVSFTRDFTIYAVSRRVLMAVFELHKA